MSSPRTSIIMPVYNTADTVVAAMESVLAQTDPDFELLVVVDGSPDHSSKVIREFLQNTPDPRIRLFDNEQNAGVSAARNQGLDEARGKWITFIDSDDTYRPEFLERLHAAAARNGADVATCGHTIARADGSTMDRPQGAPGTYTGNDIAINYLLNRFTGFVHDKIFRASLFSSVRFATDIHRAEDALAVFECLMQAQKLEVIPDCLYLYHMGSEGLTWGRVTPVEESIRHTRYMRQAGAPLLSSKEGQQAMAISSAVTYLNNAQQALMSDSTDSDAVIRECRRQIEWGWVVPALRSSPVVGAASLLLKLSPALYRTLYGAYVRRAYGM